MGAGALAVPLVTPLAAKGSTGQAASGSGFRVVHMTDWHVREGLGAREGSALAVRKVLELDVQPDLVLIGGDIGDGLMSVGPEVADRQYGWIEEVLRPFEIPVHFAVGNHDIAQWALAPRDGNPDPFGAKQRFLDRFGIEGRYRAFDHKGLRFLMLDSIHPAPEGAPQAYISVVDDEQVEWIKGELESHPGPFALVAHSPIVSGYFAFQYGPYATPGFPMLTRNTQELHDLMKPHDVLLVLQGHSHISENLIYAGRHHITSGAVSGSWWRGKRLDVDPEGFVVLDIDLTKSGVDRVQWSYHPTGWNAGAQA